jgi:hypothetical protein
MDCLDDRAAEDLGNIVAAYLEFDVPEQAAEPIVYVQVYVADFSEPHRELSELSLIKEESDQQQYRIENVVDSASGETTPCSLLSTKFAA